MQRKPAEEMTKRIQVWEKKKQQEIHWGELAEIYKESATKVLGEDKKEEKEEGAP